MSVFISGSVEKVCDIECKILNKLSASDTYTKYIDVDSIDFPTRACNTITNLVAKSLYPLNEVPGTKSYLSLLEAIHGLDAPKITKEFQTFHVIKDGCGVFDAVKSIMWDQKAKTTHNYLSCYYASNTDNDTDSIDVDDVLDSKNTNITANVKLAPSGCQKHIKCKPNNWIQLEDNFVTQKMGKHILDTIRIRTLNKIKFITAQTTCEGEFSRCIMLACAIATKGALIAVSFSGQFTSRSIAPFYLLACAGANLKFVLPTAGDSIWVVANQLTPLTLQQKQIVEKCVVEDKHLNIETEEFVKYVAGFLQSATNLRAQRNKFIESVAKTYIGKLGEKYIPDMITDDIEQKYRNEIAEVSKMWKAKFM